MRKVIGSISYDTTHARHLGSARHGNVRNPGHWIEALYRKRSGEYFLYGEGGPESPYGVAAYGRRIGGRNNVPLSPEDARSWAERHMTEKQIAVAFEGWNEPRPLSVHLNLPADLGAQVRAAAARESTSIVRLCETAIRAWLDQKDL